MIFFVVFCRHETQLGRWDRSGAQKAAPNGRHGAPPFGLQQGKIVEMLSQHNKLYWNLTMSGVAGCRIDHWQRWQQHFQTKDWGESLFVSKMYLNLVENNGIGGELVSGLIFWFFKEFCFNLNIWLDFHLMGWVCRVIFKKLILKVEILKKNPALLYFKIPSSLVGYVCCRTKSLKVQRCIFPLRCQTKLGICSACTVFYRFQRKTKNGYKIVVFFSLSLSLSPLDLPRALSISSRPLRSSLTPGSAIFAPWKTKNKSLGSKQIYRNSI